MSFAKMRREMSSLHEPLILDEEDLREDQVQSSVEHVDEIERGYKDGSAKSYLLDKQYRQATAREGEGSARIDEGRENEVRLNHATATLAATIVGAGIMALPKSFAVMGLAMGSIIFAMVFLLTKFSLSALIHAANARDCFSYSGLAKDQFGNAGSTALQISILLNNAGSMIIYLILIGDVLCGVAPEYSGLVTNLFGIHDPSVIWVSRPFVMGIVCVFLLAPLLSLRNLGLLAPMSTVSVVVASSFALSVVALAIAAITEGKLSPDYTWWPSPEALGGPSVIRMVATFIATLPVISMSLVCHYNLLPLARSLERFTDRRINLVVQRALALCTAVFITVAASGVLIFGSKTEGNILINLTPEAISTIIPKKAAVIMCFSIRLGYCTCLLSTFAMLNWALRSTVAKLTLGVDQDMLSYRSFLTTSYCLLGFLYGISIAFPSVWKAMSLTGATAAVFLAFILPGALAIKVESIAWRRIAGAVCVVLGVVMGIVGSLNTIFGT